MEEVGQGLRIGRLPSGRNTPLLAAGALLLAAAFAILLFLDRPLGGILFLGGMSLLLDGVGQFHPLFALLFPLLALMGAITDASRGLPGAALRWFVGAGVLFALGRVMRRRLVSPVRPNPAVEALTAELAALKAQRDRGEITEEEFRAKRDAAVGAFREISPEGPPSPEPRANP
jgi:hypothetical protein